MTLLMTPPVSFAGVPYVEREALANDSSLCRMSESSDLNTDAARET